MQQIIDTKTVISAQNLTKRYKELVAVNSINFAITEGPPVSCH